jgi:hypothetical protein
MGSGGRGNVGSIQVVYIDNVRATIEFPHTQERARGGRRCRTSAGGELGSGPRCAGQSSVAAGRRAGLFIRSGVERAATEGGVCRRASLRRQAARCPRRKAILVASGSRRKKRPPSRGGASARRAEKPCRVSRDAVPGSGKLRYRLFLASKSRAAAELGARLSGEQLTLVTLTCARSACRDRAPLFAPAR